MVPEAIIHALATRFGIFLVVVAAIILGLIGVIIWLLVK
jgi:hypothetical protein